MALNDDIIDAYRDQLGREPTAAEIATATSSLESGKTLNEIEQSLNRSVEGQNYDTQYLTSQYRQLFARNPEQEGYQYWLSQMQQDPTRDADIMRQYLIDAASAMDAEAYARSGSAPLTPGGYTQFTSADVQADPYSGRYATTSIYDLPTDAVNVSDIYGTRAQFVNPLNEAAVISNISGEGAWRAGQGLDVLDNAVVSATINRALNSGAMSREELGQLTTDLRAARSMDDVRAAFNKPVATVILDAQYGLQTGQGNTVAQAQERANDMQRVIDALDSEYYPSNMAVVAPAAAAANVPYAFGPNAYTGYNTMMTQADVVTPANFNQRINEIATGIAGLRPTYGTYQFNRAQPTVTVPQTYADRALLGARAPGGIDLAAVAQAAPATFGGVPATLPRPAENVSVPAGMAEPTVEGIMTADVAQGAPGMKKGGIASLAKHGRYGDTMLAHITPEEARMLKAHGGSGTINPTTGLPEFFKIPGLYQLEKATRGITRPIRKLVEPILPAVKFIAPFIPGIGMPLAVGLGALASGMEGGHGFNLKKGIMGGITAYGMSNIAQGLGAAGTTGTEAAVSATPGADATLASSSQTAGAVAPVNAPASVGVNPSAGGFGLNPAMPSSASLTPPGGFGVDPTAIASGSVPETSFMDKLSSLATPSASNPYTLSDYGRGIQNLSGLGDVTSSEAAKAFGSKAGIGSAGAVLMGTSGEAAINEQEKMQREQDALLAEKERKRKEAADRAYAAMSATPWRFAEGGMTYDDSPGVDGMAAGGSPIVAKYAAGGQPRFLSGGGDGMSDSIPANIEGKQEARLADGEFVIPADVVSHLGNGSSKAGAKRLYSMMDKVRQARTGTKKQGKEINAMKFLPA